LRAHLTLLGAGERPALDEALVEQVGAAAGALDQLRIQTAAELLRDDYTIFNRAAIGYAMLHTAAHALGHMETMEIADRHLRFYAGAVQEINQLMPDVVVWELEKAGMAVNRDAIEHCTAAINRAWRDTAPSEMPAPRAAREDDTTRRAA
jgi:acyl-CoA hydrolase